MKAYLEIAYSQGYVMRLGDACKVMEGLERAIQVKRTRDGFIKEKDRLLTLEILTDEAAAILTEPNAPAPLPV